MAGPAVALVARADRSTEPGRAAARVVPTPPGRTGTARPPAPAVPLRADASRGQLPRRPRGHRRGARRASLLVAPLARALGPARPERRPGVALRGPGTGPDGRLGAQPAALVVGARRPADAAG